MRSHRVLGKAWVRGCLLVLTSTIVIYGLSCLWQILIEDGHRTLGVTVGDLDFACVLVAFFVGPAWVTQAFQAFHAPTPPRNDGPPRGGIVPFPTRTPGGPGTMDVVGDRSDQAARVGLPRAISRAWLPSRRVTARTTH